MEEGEEEESEFASPAQLSNELITLANLPGSRWLNLLNLDVIKAKNKPKAPPKKPKAAPFFLPTIPGLATQFDLSAVEKAAEEDSPKSAIAISFTKFGAALSQAETEADMGAVLESLLELGNQLITLANLPGSRWLNLLNLDVIKAKNKPKAPPKKPKAAPFFLPTIPGLATQFDLSAVEKAAEENTLKAPVAISVTKFGAALSQAESEADMAGMLESLLELGPSAIDLELRSLAPEGGGSVGLMESFLKMIRLELKAGRNFEAVQSYLGLFLKLHGETVAEEEVLMLELALVE